ncbi:hypothetical protein ACWEQ8_23350 [Streptomyces noursei]
MPGNSKQRIRHPLRPSARSRRGSARTATAVLAAASALLLAGVSPSQAAPGPDTASAGRTPASTGTPAEPRPVPGRETQNPFMAPNGISAMHGDSQATNTQPQSGPLGRHPQVTSVGKATSPVDPPQCATATFLRNGLMVLNCGGASHHPTLRLEDPTTLKDLAVYSLPVRPSTYQAAATGNPAVMFSDTSGSYYYLDNHDRIVIAGADQHVQRLAVRRDARGRWSFHRTDDWDLRPHLPHDCATAADPNPPGECDPVTAVQADFQGLLWWVSDHGRIGTVNPATGTVRSIHRPGEEIENSFSTGPDGAYVATDQALYKLHAAPDGTPRIDWQETYDRGPGTSPARSTRAPAPPPH